MKTTIEIQDELLERSKRLARQEGTTLGAVIEEGLQLALRARAQQERRMPFALKPFAGDGLTPEFESAGWELIRDEICRDRG
jgi:hypothetical protein